VATRILHLSDLHFGARDDAAIHEEIGAFVAQTQPGLIIATGDLTHRGRADQHDRAAAFLRGLGAPVMAVPGNHDIPYSLPARVTRPWREFERLWATTEPVYSTDDVHMVGVNSVRPWRHQSGGVDDAQLGRVAQRLAAARPGALKIVALHHQLINAPWRTRKKPVARRNHVLASLVAAGAELIIGGHIHQGTVSERREFEVLDGNTRGAVMSIAPGRGRPRPPPPRAASRGVACGCVTYHADVDSITVATSIWAHGAWTRIAVRAFPRS
jgi:3',5'-cyclic AMP phosphodiesterase CpdA